MRLKGTLIGAPFFSLAILLVVKSTTNIGDVFQEVPLATTPTPARTLLPIIRQSVTLSNGTQSYHLNLTRFKEAFPYLQSYNCTIIQEPHPEEQGAPNQKLLILAVKSQPRIGARRAALRQTWAKHRDINGYKIKPLFLLGKTELKGPMEIAKLENEVYGDILQWDMMEEHHNLSLKERCFLEWMYLKLPHVDHIFKVDDDEFVNPEVIVQYITEHGSPDTIHGFHQHRPPVMRWTKYRISKALYPQEYYPGFVSGGGFLFPGASVTSLYEASQLLPVFPLDDVYFGFLSLAANLTYRHDHRFYVKGLRYNACRYKKALVVHGIDSENMGRIWQEVQDIKCSKDNTTKS